MTFPQIRFVATNQKIDQITQPTYHWNMQTSVNIYVIPRLGMAKKHDNDVDKGTNRKTPGNNQGARPPQEEDFDKVHEKRKKSGTTDQRD